MKFFGDEMSYGKHNLLKKVGSDRGCHQLAGSYDNRAARCHQKLLIWLGLGMGYYKLAIRHQIGLGDVIGQ